MALFLGSTGTFSLAQNTPGRLPFLIPRATSGVRLRT